MIRSAGAVPQLTRWYIRQTVVTLRPVVSRGMVELRQALPHAQELAPKVLARLQETHPALVARARTVLPFLLDVPEPEPEEPDPVDIVIAEFGKLERDQQDKVARNLSLLWDNFREVFGGASGFQAAPPIDQKLYLEKLEAAARRMEVVKGSEAAFHYVTVELMRQYASFLQTGSTDEKAVALARLVAPLIDRGHRMSAKPLQIPMRPVRQRVMQL
ncbi:hypothetical protein [Microvirga roseola]|uniref:hypothetical protein n=1 Tax=Microvirga roseola TaxID=2883126 RepID=UPI001E65D4B1|nr:hypothetical protein [Microvirga roseola]